MEEPTRDRLKLGGWVPGTCCDLALACLSASSPSAPAHGPTGGPQHAGSCFPSPLPLPALWPPSGMAHISVFMNPNSSILPRPCLAWPSHTEGTSASSALVSNHLRFGNTPPGWVRLRLTPISSSWTWSDGSLPPPWQQEREGWKEQRKHFLVESTPLNSIPGSPLSLAHYLFTSH